ncbi:hypothetical protein [Streptomyces sp. H27-S2]|uniref:hypothetical protein n=1 Tax=Streptomyces antarcticus TaxID=2996458 RepID=UPI002272051C|nr:hypothetical protein [Streptomyces sp. H27-S2]MCY0950397.1 hypothetical protein [Streptomyces sp. H27-S2]
MGSVRSATPSGRYSPSTSPLLQPDRPRDRPRIRIRIRIRIRHTLAHVLTTPAGTTGEPVALAQLLQVAARGG